MKPTVDVATWRRRVDAARRRREQCEVELALCGGVP